MNVQRIFLATAWCALVLPVPVLAQANGAIAGVVRDTSGAVMPGVTVEAASPALIEKTRVVVTDDLGVYRIVDLRPGVYTVTFALPGFSGFKREGIELTSAFTATVNAELKVGALEESVTVSGAAPVVDTQNALQQQTLARSTLDALPTTKRSGSYAALLPGAVSTATTQDVGGTQGEGGAAFSIHGNRSGDINFSQDGMNLYVFAPVTWSWNPQNSQEVVLETSGISAESSAAGVLVNIVPKDGGNTFAGSFMTTYTNPDLQNSNLTDELSVRGLTATPSIRKVYDVSGSLGGPVLRDKLWFFTAHRKWAASTYVPGNFYNSLHGTLFYEPDTIRPAYRNDYYGDDNLRMTWQASEKDKVAVAYSFQQNCNCPIDNLNQGTVAPEAAGLHYYQPNWLATATWTRPATNRLLLEAAASGINAGLNAKRYPEVTVSDISVVELSINRRYGSRAGNLGNACCYSTNAIRSKFDQRFSVSYITGSHAFKVGVTASEFDLRHRNYNSLDGIHGARAYSFRNQLPSSVTIYSTPYGVRYGTTRLDAFVQDQWTIRKLTLNLGMRYDSYKGHVPAEHFPAGYFAPERDFPAVENSPNWRNLNLRVGGAYDLFGTGRTAIKGFVGRYVIGTSGNGDAALNAPILNQAQSATRTWNDRFFGPGDPRTGNFVPDCVLGASVPDLNGECGALSDLTFGQVTQGNTRYADDVLTGFNDAQPYNWQNSVSVQHELRPGVALNVGYFRTWYGNFNFTDNLSVTSADYDPFCITMPVDSRLPSNISGSQLCGLYDIAPTKFGQVDNLVTQASNYGRQTEVYNGVDATVNVRFGEGGQLSGGLSVGRTDTDNCFVVDSPQQARPGYCHVSPLWSSGTQLKFLAVYPLPWALQASATYQNIPGIPIAASYVATNAEIVPTLGRNLGSCRGAATCNGTVTIDVIPPGTEFEDRIQQVDIRFSRIFTMGKARIRANFDVFNLFNASPILSTNLRYGQEWLNVQQILAGRLFKFGGHVDF